MRQPLPDAVRQPQNQGRRKEDKGADQQPAALKYEKRQHVDQREPVEQVGERCQMLRAEGSFRREKNLNQPAQQAEGGAGK